MNDFHEIFNNSYHRNVIVNDDELFEKFYNNLFRNSRIMQNLFKQTDMKRQQEMLRDSLEYMVAFSNTKISTPYMEKLSIIHHRAGVQDEFYEVWMDSLMTTLKQHDRDFTTLTELAWRIFLAPGIEFMKGFVKINQTETAGNTTSIFLKSF